MTSALPPGYDAAAFDTRVTGFIEWLERSGGGALPRPVSIGDPETIALDAARSRAVGMLAEAGALRVVHRLRHEVAGWAQDRIQRGGLSRYLFGGASLQPRERIQAIEILEDLGLAFLVYDLDLAGHDALVGRWEVGVGRRLERT
jgi:hypothetical protein